MPAWELNTGGFGKALGHKLGPRRSSLFRRHSARSVQGAAAPRASKAVT